MTERRPEFHLARVADDGSADAPEIVPVARVPWDATMSRRGAIQTGVLASAALALLAKQAQARVDSVSGSDPAAADPGLAHAGAVTAIAWTPDGRLLATAARDNTVKIWTENALRHTLFGHVDDVVGLAMLGNEWLVSGSADDTLRVWSLDEGETVATLEVPAGLQAVVAAGRLVATAHRDGGIRLWSIPDGRLVATIEPQDADVATLVADRSGGVLACPGRRNGIRRFALPAGTPLPELPTSSRVTTLALAADADRVIYGSAKETILHPVSGADPPRPAAEPHAGDVSAIAAALATGAVASADRSTLKSWTDPGAPPTSLTVAGITRLAFSPDGLTIAGGTGSGRAFLWNLTSTAPRYLEDGALSAPDPDDSGLRAHAGGVTDLALAPDGSRLVSVGADGVARVWDMPTGQLAARLREGTPITAARPLPDGLVVVGASEPRVPPARPAAASTPLPSGERLALWTVPLPEPVAPAPPGRTPRRPARRSAPGAGTRAHRVSGHVGAVVALATDRAGTRLVAAGSDGSLRIWSTSGTEPLVTLPLRSTQAPRLAFAPDGNAVAAASAERVRVVSGADGRLLQLFGHDRAVESLAFSPDGTTLFTGSADGHVRVWSLAAGRLTATWGRPGRPVKAVAVSPDGSRLAATEERGVRCWSVADGKLIGVLEGHTGPVTDLAFLPDGQRLVSGAEDGSVRLWSLNPLGLDATLRVHQRSIRAMALEPGGRWLVTGDQSGIIVLWDLDELAFHSFLFDPEATAGTVRGTAYDVYDTVTGRWVTYTLPCGSPIPRGAVCTCNCVAGSLPAPRRPTTTRTYRTGRTICTCNKVCVCVPVYRPSSRHLKNGVRPLEAALERLAQLRGVAFVWRADAPTERAGQADVGVIAEEVARVLPEAVGPGPEPTLGVDYGRLTPLLIEAIKEQQAQMTRLLERVADLERRVGGTPSQPDR